MKTSVVILNYNTRSLLEKFLPEVIALSKNVAEVVVCDNDSTDDSVACLRQKFPNVKLIINKSNGGFAKGYNDCLKLINSEYLLLLNSDVQVTQHWIEPLIEMLDNNPQVAAVQPKIISYNNKELFEFAGAAGGFIDRLGYPFCRGRIFNAVEKDTHQYDNACEIFWATGACMLVRKKVFEEMNGFDEEFFAHMEEIDLCWRMQHAGYKIMYQPKSVVYHVGGGTLSTGSARKTYFNFRNNLLMLHKNIPQKKYYRVMLTKMILDGVAAVKFLFSDGMAHMMAVLNAHIYFYKHLKTRRQLRHKVQSEIKNYHLLGVYTGSIVADFYLKGKKKFTDLNKDHFTVTDI